jgi:hypothetical protein
MNQAQAAQMGVRLASSPRTAFRRFVDAVDAIANDPSPANVGRYLAASQELEKSRGREEDAQ